MNTTEKIWSELGTRLKTFIRSKVSDAAAVDDIFQELFIRIHIKTGTLKDETKLKPWLYQIARNLIADYYRNNAAVKPQITPEQVSVYEDADEQAMEEATRDMIRMMDDLPPDYCEALCLTELEGLSQAAYAERKGIAYSTAKSRVQRSRKLLRDRLMRCCHYQFDKYGTVLGITPKHCCCCNPVPTGDLPPRIN